jgi:hypothetical protein
MVPTLARNFHEGNGIREKFDPDGCMNTRADIAISIVQG